MTDSRLATGPQFERSSANTEILSQKKNWEIWKCSDPVFSHFYAETVTLHVNRGTATLAFSDGSSVAL